MKRYCLALDLVDDEALIAEYDNWHRRVWPEVLRSLKESGIEKMEIYRVSNRLFMIIEANDHFSLARKKELDAANPMVQEWEKMMWQYQQSLPGTLPGEKWRLMDKVFEL